MHLDISQPLERLFQTEPRLNNEVLGACAGVSRDTVRRWREGTHGPSIVEMRRMRDCDTYPIILPLWFRQFCSQIGEMGRKPGSEHGTLDADGDGRVTSADLRVLDGRCQMANARTRASLETALADGRISPEERAELQRLILDAECAAKSELRALELASR